MERTLKQSEIFDRYETCVKPLTDKLITACLQSSNNVRNQYEILECATITLLQMLTRTHKQMYPNISDEEFLKTWTDQGVEAVARITRNQNVIDMLKKGASINE